MIITSTQNTKIKQLKKLMQDKSLVFFDNPKMLDEAVFAGQKVIYIIKSEFYNGKTDYGGELVEVSDSVFKTFSTTKNSQGIIGVVKFQKKELKRPLGNFLVLDGLQDPGNVGTLIRSALGTNFLDIYLIESVNISNDKLLRASMGAVFKTRFYEISRQEFIEKYKEWKLPLYACDMDGENVFNLKTSGQVGIAIGNEGNGLSDEILNIATKKVGIPMANGLESLNAGVSGSIIMYQITN